MEEKEVRRETSPEQDPGNASAEGSVSGKGHGGKKGLNQKKHNHLANILAALAVICVLTGGVIWYKTRSGGDIYAEIQQAAVEDEASEAETAATTQEPAAEATTAAAAAATTAAAPAEEIPIDFETLWKTCPDAYAWIRIPETQIDYPVCQMVEGDQSFYLNHRADKVAEFAGAIYSENYNTRDFTDPVTVLYGHDMSNGSMFQNLHFYEDRAFFEKNREVIIYMPDKVLHYRIFAAYNTNDDHLLLNNDCFRDPGVFELFLQDIMAQRSMSGFVDQNTQLSVNSRILTLSTCNAYDDQRYLVQCLLTNPEAVMPDPLGGAGRQEAASSGNTAGTASESAASGSGQ